MIKFRMSKKISLTGLRPEMVIVTPIVLSAAEDYNARYGASGEIEEVVLSCGSNGAHSRGSLHYVGAALDYDVVKFVASQTAKWCDLIRERLSEEYDVVAHSSHAHVEFQPKVNRR